MYPALSPFIDELRELYLEAERWLRRDPIILDLDGDGGGGGSGATAPGGIGGGGGGTGGTGGGGGRTESMEPGNTHWALTEWALESAEGTSREHAAKRIRLEQRAAKIPRTI
jgi:hypothetical protein